MGVSETGQNPMSHLCWNMPRVEGNLEHDALFLADYIAATMAS